MYIAESVTAHKPIIQEGCAASLRREAAIVAGRAADGPPRAAQVRANVVGRRCRTQAPP